MDSNSLIVLFALKQFWRIIILVNLGPSLILMLNCGDRLLAKRANRLSVRLEPHFQTDSVEHVFAVAVEFAHLVFHSILLETNDTLVDLLVCLSELLSV